MSRSYASTPALRLNRCVMVLLYLFKGSLEGGGEIHKLESELTRLNFPLVRKVGKKPNIFIPPALGHM
jgi:hypothetical protein